MSGPELVFAGLLAVSASFLIITIGLAVLNMMAEDIRRERRIRKMVEEDK